MTTIKVRTGETIERALRSLKKRLDKEAVMRTLKMKRHYKKPSDHKREKSKMALKYRRQR